MWSKLKSKIISVFSPKEFANSPPEDKEESIEIHPSKTTAKTLSKRWTVYVTRDINCLC